MPEKISRDTFDQKRMSLHDVLLMQELRPGECCLQGKAFKLSASQCLGPMIDNQGAISHQPFWRYNYRAVVLQRALTAIRVSESSAQYSTTLLV